VVVVVSVVVVSVVVVFSSVVPLSLLIEPGGGFSSGTLGVAEPESPGLAITIPTTSPVTTAARAMRPNLRMKT
jgi:hypothetical protein